MSQLSIRFLPNIWSSYIFLMICLSFGLLMSLLSNKMFLVWLGLELNMFGVMPFLNSSPSQTKNILFLSSDEMKVSFFYFFVQVMGSLFFAWGSVLSNWFTMSIMGLMMKMGMAPFFWWVNPIMSRIDWFSMGILSTIQKIPGILLFRLMFDLDLNLCVLFSILGFFVSVIGMKFSSKKLKSLMAWSSVSKMSMLFVLVILNKSMGVVYYLFYSFLVLLFCGILNFTNNKIVCSSFLNGNNVKNKFLVSFLLLVFSGLPPFVSFLLKVYFFSSIYFLDCSNMLMDIDLNGKSVSFFYLLGSSLKSWNVVMIFVVLMIFQSVGYMKAFINLNSTSLSRLEKSSNLTNKNMSLFLIFCLLMYFLSLVLMSF